MRKLLLTLPVLVGASWAAGTYLNSNLNQSGYEQLLSEYNNRSGFTLEKESYNAGLLSSTAVTRVSRSGSGNEKLSFRLQHRMSHSPVQWIEGQPFLGASVVQTTLLTDDVTDPDIEKLLQSFTNAQPLQISSLIHYHGDTAHSIRLNAVNYATDKGRFLFDGADYEIQTHGEDLVKGHGTVGAFQIQQAKQPMTISTLPAPSSFDLKIVRRGIYTGESSIEFPRIEVSTPSSGEITLEGLSVSSTSSIHDDRNDSALKIDLARLQAPLPLNSLQWSLAVNGVSLDGLERYLELIQSASQQNVDENRDVALHRQEEELMNAVQALVEPGFSVSNQLSLHNDGGNLASDINVTLAGLNLSDYQAKPLTVREVLRKISAHLAFTADADAVNITPLGMLMTHPVARSYIVHDGQTYVSNLELNDLILTANGQAQSLEDLLGPLLDTVLSGDES